MKKVAIMVDSIAHMPQELADKYNVKMVPMGIVIDGKAYPETEVDLPQYYQELLQITETEKLPTSSSVTVGSFLEKFRELSQEAEAILYIGHSIKLGMSVNSATQAKKMIEEELPDFPIEVIDSGTALGAQMFIAEEAARAAAAGKSFAEVVEVAKDMIPRVKYICIVDNLDYLTSGGRILDSRPWAEAKVKTKALILTDAGAGKVHAPLARYKTKGQAMKGFLEILKERCGDKKLHVMISHVNALEEAEELRKKISSQFQCAELYVTETYPVVGRHVGPGSHTIGWWCED